MAFSRTHPAFFSHKHTQTETHYNYKSKITFTVCQQNTIRLQGLVLQ